MATYDGYVWRLYSVAPFDVYEVVLPKDLLWVDEFTWTPISQDIKNTLTGGLVINEYEALVGRPISFTGKDDMAWVQRNIIEVVVLMRNTAGLQMKLDFVAGAYDNDLDTWSFGAIHKTMNVMFRHNETPLEFENVKGFDAFDDNSWYMIKNIRFMDIGNTNPTNPCS